MTYGQFHGRGFSKPAYDIIRLLISEPDFRYCFFYCPELKKESLLDEAPCNISHVRDAIIDKVDSQYGYELSQEYCSTIIYETLWAKGTFKPLESYKHTGPFDGWLYKVGLNAVVARLKKEDIIPRATGRNAANTRLTMLSQSTGVCERVIDDLISDTQDHRLLTALYVDRLSNSLKTALLRENHPFRDSVLHDKSSAEAAKTLPLDDAKGLSSSDEQSIYKRIFGDVLGTNLEDGDISDTVVAFLKGFIQKLKWKPEDIYLWCERFINGTAPTTLARELGRSRDWVDHRYSLLNNRFKLAIRKWWQLNAA